MDCLLSNQIFSNNLYKLLSCLLFLNIVNDLAAQQPLAATDELGRVLPHSDKVGDVKSDKHVGIFYFLWQGHEGSRTSQYKYDLSELVSSYPEILQDFDNPNWGTVEQGGYYFWGRPIYEYYKGTDFWVHLRNMQLLADAGVDFLFLDATNNIHYPEESEALMKAIERLLHQGRPAPKICYYTNTHSASTMQAIYDDFYKEGAKYYHPKTWFYLDGKPLIIGVLDSLKNRNYENFFTFRASQWPNEANKVNGWPWIDFVRPQHVYTNESGQREVINVAASAHPNLKECMGGSAFYGGEGNWGRSYRNGAPGYPDKDIKFGYNIQEAWDFAIKQNLPYVLVTGWNEWIAGRWHYGSKDRAEHSLFVDQASPEYSRDIEPTYTAGLKDNYYLQLVANIRRYKGIQPIQRFSKPARIVKISDWEKVRGSHWDYIGDTEHRNHPGAQSKPSVTYINTAGRNDFHELKFSWDSNNLYFYVKTVENITSNNDPSWMNLFINVDRNYVTGWEGFDYRVRQGNQLNQFKDGAWLAIGTVQYQVIENQMFITIPFNKLSPDINRRQIDMEYKWSDNMQNTTDPLDWYVNGDTAPGGRFSFVIQN